MLEVCKNLCTRGPPSTVKTEKWLYVTAVLSGVYSPGNH